MEAGQDRIRVVLADDHDLVRSGIKALLERMPGVRVVGEAASGEELLAVLRGGLPDLVVTDLSMPHMDGLAAMARLHAQHPQLRILVLSMYETGDFVRRALAAGACGYLMKASAPAQLEAAVQAVASRGSYIDTRVATLLAAPPAPGLADLLTPRQIEILQLLVQGHASKEIGFRLGLSSKTVDAHRARILERLDLRDLASLTRFAVREGLVDP